MNPVRKAGIMVGVAVLGCSMSAPVHAVDPIIGSGYFKSARNDSGHGKKANEEYCAKPGSGAQGGIGIGTGPDAENHRQLFNPSPRPLPADSVYRL